MFLSIATLLSAYGLPCKGSAWQMKSKVKAEYFHYACSSLLAVLVSVC